MTSWGGAYQDVWSTGGIPTPTVQAEMSGLGGNGEHLRMVPSSAASSARHLGAGLSEPVESSGLIIPSINDKAAHFQAFMINSWPHLMCSLPTFPGTTGRWRFLGREAAEPYGHLGSHAAFPVPCGGLYAGYLAGAVCKPFPSTPQQKPQSPTSEKFQSKRPKFKSCCPCSG